MISYELNFNQSDPQLPFIEFSQNGYMQCRQKLALSIFLAKEVFLNLPPLFVLVYIYDYIYV